MPSRLEDFDLAPIRHSLRIPSFLLTVTWIWKITKELSELVWIYFHRWYSLISEIWFLCTGSSVRATPWHAPGHEGQNLPFYVSITDCYEYFTHLTPPTPSPFKFNVTFSLAWNIYSFSDFSLYFFLLGKKTFLFLIPLHCSVLCCVLIINSMLCRCLTSVGIFLHCF